MTEIDPKYQAKAAVVTAARVAEEAARRIRRRKCFGYGLLVDELIASTNPLHEIPGVAEDSARNLLAGVEVIPRTKGQSNESGRLGYRRSSTNIAPLPIWATRFLCDEYSTVGDALRAAEADLD